MSALRSKTANRDYGYPLAANRRKPTLDDSEHATKSSAVPVALQNNLFGSQILLGSSDGFADE
jgi:hypothetical protein